MEAQLGLADVVATILGFHVRELVSLPTIQPSAVEKMSPDMRSAYFIWIRLVPYIKDNLSLGTRLEALANSPGESTRQAVSDGLEPLLESDYKLRTEIRDIIRQSPYVVLMGGPDAFGAAPAHSIRSPKTMSLIGIFALVMLMWLGFFIPASPNVLWLFPFMFVIQGILIGNYARRSGIKHYLWLGFGAMLPANIIYILLALAGYRCIDDLPEGRQVYYTPFSKTAMKILAVGLLILPVVSSLTDPSYMNQLLSDPIGWAFLAAVVVSYVVGGAALTIGFWQDKANTGIWMVLAATAAGWASMVVIGVFWLIPAVVKLVEAYG